MEKKKKEDKYYLPRDISWMYFRDSREIGLKL